VFYYYYGTLSQDTRLDPWLDYGLDKYAGNDCVTWTGHIVLVALQIFVKTLICKTIALEVESSDATMSRQRSRTYVHYLRWLVHQILHLVVGSIFLMPMGCNTININLYAKRYFIAGKCDNLTRHKSNWLTDIRKGPPIFKCYSLACLKRNN